MIPINPENNWLDEQVLKNGKNIFLKTNECSLTYENVQSHVRNYANYFSDFEISPARRVVVILPHGTELVKTILALWEMGAVPVLINSLWHKNQVNELIEKYRFDKIISNSKHISVRKTPCNEIIDIKEIPVNHTNHEKTKFNLKNKALVLFTSGSTDKPKGVVFTFENLLQSALNVDSFVNHTTKDMWLAGLPIYHIGGFSIITRTLLSGCSMFIPESIKNHDIKQSLNKNITLTSLVTTQLKRLTDDNIQSPSSLRYLFIGGGPSENELIDKSIKLGYPVVKVYGSTETSSMVTAIDMKNTPDKIDSSGKTLGDVVININDNTGEIGIKSKCISDYYLTGEEVVPVKDSNGFYNSGDIGLLRNEYLYVTDRTKRIIISGGENISALEIVNVLLTHPDIDDAYVLPVQNDKWGEVPLAVIALSISSDTTLSGIMEYVNSRLSSYQQPRRYLVVDEIPRNELGKINMYEIEELIKRSYPAITRKDLPAI